MQLAQRLIQKGFLTEADLPRLAEATAALPDRPIHEILIERGFAKEDAVLATLAEEFGLELVDLTQVKIDQQTLSTMPQKLVHRRNLMPLSRDNGTLVVATGNPFDISSLDELQTLTGLHIHTVLASPRVIECLIKKDFGVGGATVPALVW